MCLVNKRRSFFHLGFIARGGCVHTQEHRGPWEVTFGGAPRVERRIRRAFSARRGLRVWMSAFSPVEGS